MELIYSMRRKPLKCEPPYFKSLNDPEVTRPICTISTANIIAFSSPTELSDTDGDTWSGHVYVCDLETPWDAHKVTSTAYPVSALEWDMEGRQLLVASTVGDVSVFTQKDYLLNEWTCAYSASFPGEHIIRASFFHNGRRIAAADKKPDAPLADRYHALRPAPTLKGFGGVACEGACIVTATGLLGALTPPAASAAPPAAAAAGGVGAGAGGGARAHTATECLRPTRDHVTAASIAHKMGSVVVAAVCVQRGSGTGGGRGRSCVRCYACAVTSSPAAAPLLAAQPLPTVYLPHADTYNTPVCVSWWLREDSDALLVAGSSLTLWKCTERPHQVHKLFNKGPLQGNTTPGGGPKPTTDCFNSLMWQKAGAWAVEGGSRCVWVSSARAAAGVPAAAHAALASPAALHLLNTHTHHYLCSRPVVTSGGGGAEAGATPPKKNKYGSGALPAGSAHATVSCVELSALGGVAVAIDTHAQLHVYRAQSWDAPTAVSLQQASALLEYALVAGCDCLDVLMTLKHGLAEPLYERLTETFQRQPAAFQQYYYHSWLKLRIALCRVMSGGSRCVSWLTCYAGLRAAWAAAGAALRPDDRADDKPLAALLDHHAHEHDKYLLALEAKTEVLPECVCAGLAPLRLPLQRALDVALTALLALAHHHQHPHAHPHPHPHPHPHGYELWSDASAVSLLRKLALLARAACRSAAPAADALARPLARLAAACSAPKPDLIEECLSLTAQWSGARVWEAPPRCGVTAPHAHHAPHATPAPLLLEYGVEPEALRYTPEPPPYAQCETVPSITMDSIRYMYLGGGSRPARWRQCSRCGARALPAAQPSRHPLQRAYDARFLSACRCGGKWTLFSNI